MSAGRAGASAVPRKRSGSRAQTLLRLCVAPVILGLAAQLLLATPAKGATPMCSGPSMGSRAPTSPSVTLLLGM